MALTHKQEAFCQRVADGMSQSDAYRCAFDVASTTKAETVQANASRLMGDSMVSARVQELKERLEEISLWKRIDSVRGLADIARGIDPDAKASDRVSAIKALNTMHGWDAAQKVEHAGPDGQPLVMMPMRIELVAPEGKS